MEKTTTDLDELNKVTVERVSSVKTELEGRIQDETKERADIIRDTLNGIEGEIVSVKDLVQREKAALEEAIQGRYSVVSWESLSLFDWTVLHKKSTVGGERGSQKATDSADKLQQYVSIKGGEGGPKIRYFCKHHM